MCACSALTRIIGFIDAAGEPNVERRVRNMGFRKSSCQKWHSGLSRAVLEISVGRHVGGLIRALDHRPTLIDRSSEFSIKGTQTVKQRTRSKANHTQIGYLRNGA
jgi:hypothetical protein